jgi:hypothetical protein
MMRHTHTHHTHHTYTYIPTHGIMANSTSDQLHDEALSFTFHFLDSIVSRVLSQLAITRRAGIGAVEGHSRQYDWQEGKMLFVIIVKSCLPKGLSSLLVLLKRVKFGARLSYLPGHFHAASTPPPFGLLAL